MVALSDILFFMVKAYRTRLFTRWMHKSGLTDDLLRTAVSEMLDGLIDADLGGHVFKKRIALPGKGKSGGVRTIVATRVKTQWFFLVGFAKNERANLDQKELKAVQELARSLLSLDEEGLQKLLALGNLMEIEYGSNQG
jgi:hypothetical protein